MKVYPRRTDGLIAIQFQDNAVEISRALRREVTVTHDPAKRASQLELPGGYAPYGSWILINGDREVVKVLDHWEFLAQYSEDGL